MSFGVNIVGMANTDPLNFSAFQTFDAIYILVDFQYHLGSEKLPSMAMEERNAAPYIKTIYHLKIIIHLRESHIQDHFSFQVSPGPHYFLANGNFKHGVL